MDVVGVADGLPRPRHLPRHHVVEAVEGVGPVQRDRRDMVGARLEQDGLGVHAGEASPFPSRKESDVTVVYFSMALPDSITAWIGEVMGAPVTAAKRVPGGASREAWFVDVGIDDGAARPLFLRYDPNPKPPGGLFHPLRVEAAVLIALPDT